MDIRAYLANKGFEWTEAQRPKGLVAVMNCPVCHEVEKKFAISLEDGAFSCLHENKCGVKGSWYDFQRIMGDEPKPLDGKSRAISAKAKQYQAPKPVKRFITPTGAVLDWLTGRGFTPDTLAKYKVAMVDGEETVALPYFKGGKLVNVKYRAIGEKKFWSERNCEPVLYNRDAIPADAEWLIITEGEFDALAMCQYGQPAVSMPGGASNMDWIEREWAWLQRFTTIILAMDGDNPGREAADNAAKRLGTWRCRRVVWPDGHKDANDCLRAGVSRAAISAALVDANDYKPAELASAHQFTDAVIHMIENPELLSGTPTAFDGLTKILGGWRYPEFSVWSGQNSSGKSTILNQVLIDLVARGIPCCVASLEMPPKRYLRWATVQYTQCTWPSPERVREALATLGRMLYVVDIADEVSIDTLLDLFRYAARRYGCKHFIIDSLMMLKTDQMHELEQQKAICHKLCAFAKECGVHAHLVAHPRKGVDDDDKPGKVDVAGTGHITNKADNVLIMWRPSEDLKEKKREQNTKRGRLDEIPPDAVLYLKKNRETGTHGKVKLWFDAEIKRFTEDENAE